ncbi:hypothetical protein GQ53DRAFT_244880 [Thozetella sp. PMI_491]|nr:hypothetical protein GQ53DRAFT_244880 [Thozetella sp. PMI_491]
MKRFSRTSRCSRHAEPRCASIVGIVHVVTTRVDHRSFTRLVGIFAAAKDKKIQPKRNLDSVIPVRNPAIDRRYQLKRGLLKPLYRNARMYRRRIRKVGVQNRKNESPSLGKFGKIGPAWARVWQQGLAGCCRNVERHADSIVAWAINLTSLCRTLTHLGPLKPERPIGCNSCVIRCHHRSTLTSQSLRGDIPRGPGLAGE